MSSKIEVVAYDPNWPLAFDAEKKIILEALGDNCECIHHIGSTSVPGLSAKPKIDIIAAAKNRESAINSLKNIGYSYKGEWNIPLKCGFTKQGQRSVNLHIFFEKDHPEIELNLLFRDYLRSHPEACKDYADLKTKILQDKSSSDRVGKLLLPAYTLKKRNFICDLLRKAGFNRLRVLKCAADAEWDIAKQLRQKYFFDEKKIPDPDHWTFNHKDHEHFILYLGVEIIGYAHIHILSDSTATVPIIIVDDKNIYYRSKFLSIIEEWMKIHKYRYVLAHEK